MYCVEGTEIPCSQALTLERVIPVSYTHLGFDKAPGALDFNKDKKPAEQSGESAAAGLAPLDFDKEKAEDCLLYTSL